MTTDRAAKADTKRIFISHSGHQKDNAAWFAGVLEQADYSVTIQQIDFVSGDSFLDDIREGIEDCGTVLALLSADYWASRWCNEEFKAAYKRKVEKRGLLIPVVLGPHKLPEIYGTITHVDFSTLTGTAHDKARFLVGEVDAAIRGNREFGVATAPTPNALTNLPPAPPHFTGRTAELAQLEAALWAEGANHAAALTAVHGFGGVGKSAIALHYAHEAAPRYAGTWWVRSEQPTTLTEDLGALALRLDKTLDRDDPALAEKGARLADRYAHSQGKPLLLVLDNVETPQAVPPYVRTPNLHLIVTSRFRKWGGDTAAVEIETLSRESARDLLLRTAQREPGDGLDPLLDALGDLPLALVQAGAFLRESDPAFYSFADYLAELETLIAELPTDWDQDRKAVSATFTPSIKRAEAEAPGAHALLQAAAYYAPDDIPLTLLADDPTTPEVRKAAGALSKYSLAKTGAPSEIHGPSITLHRLLQTVLRTEIPAPDRPTAMEAAATRLHARMEGDAQDVRSWPCLLPLAPHTVALNDYTADNAAKPALASALGEIGMLLKVRSDYAEAEPLTRRALAIDEASHGPDHPDVAISLNNLATLLQATNRLEEAEPLMRRALAIDEASYGPDHPEVATDLNNLAGLLQATNRLEEAEPLMARVVEIFETSYDEIHPNVATALNNLAQLLQDTNRLEEAEPLVRRHCDIFEVSYGADHPQCGIAWLNHALLLFEMNRHPEAIPLIIRASENLEASGLPDGHPWLEGVRTVMAQLRDAGAAL